MFHVRLDIITMAGNQYVLYERDGAPTFPHGELRNGEQPADAARRIVKEWTGTEAPKLELADLKVISGGALQLLVRAHLTGEPTGSARRVGRMELPSRVGVLAGAEVEEALKTSLSYKLTRG